MRFMYTGQDDDLASYAGSLIGAGHEVVYDPTHKRVVYGANPDATHDGVTGWVLAVTHDGNLFVNNASGVIEVTPGSIFNLEL